MRRLSTLTCFDSGKTVSAVSASRVEARTVANAAPSFAEQDDDPTDRTVIEVSREVNENAGKGSPVGKPVSATDADSDVLIYTLIDGTLDTAPLLLTLTAMTILPITTAKTETRRSSR